MTTKFYVDECLDSDDFVAPLIEIGLKVVRHRDILEKGVLDKEWMEDVGQAGYYALTEDNEIRKEGQSEVVREKGVGVFIIRCTKCSHSEKGSLVVWYRRNILRFIEKNDPPYIATVTQSGVTGIYPKDRVWGQKYTPK